MGAPEKASPEKGLEIVEDAVATLTKLFTDLERTRSEKYAKVQWTPEPLIL
jgi:creatinine amidohydrolase/Fe(II)-dependent formamide hydrolase-like protein